MDRNDRSGMKDKRLHLRVVRMAKFGEAIVSATTIKAAVMILVG